MSVEVPSSSEDQKSNEHLTSALEVDLKTLAKTLPTQTVEFQGFAGRACERLSHQDSLDLDALPDQKKVVLLWGGEPGAAPLTYHIKTEGYNPHSFFVPDARLPLEPKDVHEVSLMDDGLLMVVLKHGLYLPITSQEELEWLQFGVVDKSPRELTEDMLRLASVQFRTHNLHVAKQDEYARSVEESSAVLREVSDSLPKGIFLEASFRGREAIQLFVINEQAQLVQVAEINPEGYEKKFIGNAMVLMGGKVYLHDTVAGLYCLINETPRAVDEEGLAERLERDRNRIINYAERTLF